MSNVTFLWISDALILREKVSVTVFFCIFLYFVLSISPLLLNFSMLYILDVDIFVYFQHKSIHIFVSLFFFLIYVELFFSIEIKSIINSKCKLYISRKKQKTFHFFAIPSFVIGILISFTWNSTCKTKTTINESKNWVESLLSFDY